MPRSIQAILDHADELAEQFAAYEPTAGDEQPVADYLLKRAALARARSERPVHDADELQRPDEDDSDRYHHL